MEKVYQVNAQDNVAVALRDLEAGPVTIFGAGEGTIELLEPLPMGFKVALEDIPAGGVAVKYNMHIARASEDIKKGACVHVHNAKSFLDDRSNVMNEDNTPSRLEYTLP